MDQQAAAPSDLRHVAQFLRNGSTGMRLRVGVLNGKKVDYFKGSSAMKALRSPAYARLPGVPTVTNDDEARTVLHAILTFAFFLRVERGAPSGSATSPRRLKLISEQKWEAPEFYAWFYEGSQWTTYAGSACTVALMLIGLMHPLWPPVMKKAAYYLGLGSLGILAALLVTIVLRLALYAITSVIASPGVWLFPRLLAEVGVVESFTPLWSLDVPKPRRKLPSSSSLSKKAKGKQKERTDIDSDVLSPAEMSSGSRPSSPLYDVQEQPIDLEEDIFGQ
ncbi:translocation protein [Cylindrobasidium torrendii FP15055 ss-10]|uniref:Translocation protein SEC62 n=1 Tax=Cylindrobasidium torrendii FP15055 ss-10 TaxID=1314674 RepID=A0A0D7B674_9AGAR|nr:translocation protein [Cylindrobasidium torrendii FP15055 ss-10]